MGDVGRHRDCVGSELCGRYHAERRGDLLRWKVSRIARHDHVRPSNECRRDHMFVVDVGQSERAFQAFQFATTASSNAKRI